MVDDYLERVYAGVLGKIIGVYLGRPFEGWSYDRISAELGEVRYYVHERLGKPLVVADDDISGTFTFLRALEDHGYPRSISSREIGASWLNYLIEGRTVLWWGGMGNSTEHTAYLRLKSGIEAPASGSAALNGRVVAEQIGAQIFIDGWAMVCPGDPERAALLAEAAARVSHDGEAVYGAQVVAAMEALAFVESDLGKLLDAAVRLIPRDSVIARLIADLREWRAAGLVWREARRRLEERYGYQLWGGGCHMIPNHGLVILSLLYGEDDFQRSLMIVNTSGWDTDCNSGNVGCLMGIKNGLAGIEGGPDWRGPVADRLVIPTADGGGAITDAAREALRVANTGRRLAGLGELRPKGGARFHFELKGSVQGFLVEHGTGLSAGLENVAGHSGAGTRSLAITYRHVAAGAELRVGTATFLPEEHAGAGQAGGYGLFASPTLYPGQRIAATMSAAPENTRAVTAGLFIKSYGARGTEDRLMLTRGPALELAPGKAIGLDWVVPDLGGQPVAEVGVELASVIRADGTVYLDSLDWSGEPRVVLGPPSNGGLMWRRAWVNGADHFAVTSEPYRVIQDSGRGLVLQGTREWRDYRVQADVTVHMAEAAGIAARAQGMRRYYALLVCRDGSLRLVKVVDVERVLASESMGTAPGETHRLALELRGNRIRASCDTKELFDLVDPDTPLEGGAVALVCEVGRMASGPVSVEPAGNA